jgi:hypothetical protein
MDAAPTRTTVTRRGRHPARSAVAVAIMTLACLLPSSSTSQTGSQGQTLGSVNIALMGTITSTVVLTVEGSTNQNGGAGTTIAGSGARGTIDFGNFRVPGPSANGERYRVERAAQGHYLVATVKLKTQFSGSGGTNAVLDIQRANPCGGPSELPCGAPGSLFYAKLARRVPNQPAAWPAWDQYPDLRYGSTVFDVPDSSYVPGTGNLDALMANGESIDHQIAVWIPDTAPSGAFSSVVTYTVTRP